MIKTLIEALSLWAIPIILIIVLSSSVFKKVPLYDSFIDGAKEGFSIGVKIIPYLVAILVAIGMFRASGAIDILAKLLSPVLHLIGLPSEVLPLVIIRPLSGSGSLGIVSEIANHYGGDSYLAKLAAVMAGSTETTFYVLAVYFGSVGIKRFRHAIAAGLIADIAGMLAALFICRIFFL